MLLGVLLLVVAWAVFGPFGAIVVIAIALTIGMRMGRVWGFNQLGSYESRERMRRAKQGGWGIF